MGIELKEINKKEMGARIRGRREVLNISRTELSKQVSVSSKFLSDVECGDKGVSIKTLYKLMQVLGVSADFLLAGDTMNMPDEKKKKQLSENILSSLSVCSVEQLGCMEQIARLYIEGIVNKE